MDKLKTVLTLIAVILALVLRFLMKPGPRQLDAPDPERELRKVERTLEEYKRKQLLK